MINVFLWSSSLLIKHNFVICICNKNISVLYLLLKQFQSAHHTSCMYCQFQLRWRNTPIALVSTSLKRFSSSKLDINNVTVSCNLDSKLVKLMDQFAVEDAVKFVKSSIHKGVLPSGFILVNLMQQLCNLGEVDKLLSIKDFAFKDKSPISGQIFMTYLKDAYCDSGRIAEAITAMRQMYFRKRNFQEIELFFTLITIPSIKDLPNEAKNIEHFVQDCCLHKDFKPLSCLWKCYMLAGMFHKANEMLCGKYEQELQALIAEEVMNICRVNTAELNHVDIVSVLQRTLQLQFLQIEEKARITEMLLNYQCKYWRFLYFFI